MKFIKAGLLFITLIAIFICANSCTNKQSDVQNTVADTENTFNYLEQLEGKWIVQEGKEEIFKWEFDLTARDNVIIEILKKGTPLRC